MQPSRPRGRGLRTAGCGLLRRRGGGSILRCNATCSSRLRGRLSSGIVHLPLLRTSTPKDKTNSARPGLLFAESCRRCCYQPHPRTVIPSPVGGAKIQQSAWEGDSGYQDPSGACDPGLVELVRASHDKQPPEHRRGTPHSRKPQGDPVSQVSRPPLDAGRAR